MTASKKGHSRRNRAVPRAAKDAIEEAGERVQKVLAQQGIGSRRELEEWITAGRIKVNGELAHLGLRVVGRDRIEVDGRVVRLQAQHPTEVLLLNKSAGVVCTRKDEEGRRTIFDALPGLRGGRWISIGRLDIQTAGLLLLTNDGELAHRMMHPSTGLDREYAVRINAELDDAAIATLKAGVEVEGELLRFSDIRFFNGSGMNYWYHVVIMEGRNREVRRLFESLGCTVSRLKRVRFGPVILPSWLRSGQWTYLQDTDVQELGKLLSVTVERSNQNEKRARVAKTTCLLPYPELRPAPQKPATR